MDHVLRAAARHGIRLGFLLTDTAEDSFPRHGFARMPRVEAPAAVRESVDRRESVGCRESVDRREAVGCREACPASATVMRRTLAP